LSCGVCGAGLSSTPSLTLEAAESVVKEESRNRASEVHDPSNSIKIGIGGVLSGVGLMVIGIILFSLVSSLWPVLLVIPGMVLILGGLDNLSQTFSRPLFSRGFWRIRDGTMSMRREAEREAAEQKKIESGEAD
jgi:hypothetical protein